MTRWQDVSDPEFVNLSGNYASMRAYAQSFGLKHASPYFSDRVKRLGVVFSSKECISKEEFSAAVEGSTSIVEVVRRLTGGEYKRSYYTLVHRLSQKYEVPIPQHSSAGLPVNKFSDDEFFTLGSKRSGHSIRNRLIAKGRPYRCDNDECPLHLPEEVVYINKVPKLLWAGNLITIQVDHTDGNNLNNLEDNLRFLCPNCHAATDTYTGKNINKGIRVLKNMCKDCGASVLKDSVRCKSCSDIHKKATKKITYPEVPEMIQAVQEIGYRSYSRSLGVSDNAIRKHLIRSGVSPLPKKLPGRRMSSVDID